MSFMYLYIINPRFPVLCFRLSATEAASSLLYQYLESGAVFDLLDLALHPITHFTALCTHFMPRTIKGYPSRFCPDCVELTNQTLPNIPDDLH